MTSRVERIRTRLEEALSPVHLEITDDSMAHAGHAGAMEGGGHFSAIIVSDVFEGKSPVQRHQLVYRALGDMMQKEIHAFSIKAFTPLEFQRKGNP
ncbi:BolA family protein [Methylocaldum szegediense]|uniref:BolA family transcriptional regulator, general stress-responsive regulator n=1 Tax=Methylocaldum szegediense TaxID=73780 RepID=A0ABM9HVP0_9GAMM|nr:BolA family protein [Methylocaldum szegediense]CAI8716844.1 BolA family transcriptional regulator, general stress-responsive regulator [Methylocaldum szegediense]